MENLDTGKLVLSPIYLASFFSFFFFLPCQLTARFYWTCSIFHPIIQKSSCLQCQRSWNMITIAFARWLNWCEANLLWTIAAGLRMMKSTTSILRLGKVFGSIPVMSSTGMYKSCYFSVTIKDSIAVTMQSSSMTWQRCRVDVWYFRSQVTYYPKACGLHWSEDCK